MTKRLDPEVVALGAVGRALRPLTPESRRRIAIWLDAFTRAEQIKLAQAKEGS